MGKGRPSRTHRSDIVCGGTPNEAIVDFYIELNIYTDQFLQLLYRVTVTLTLLGKFVCCCN